VCERRTDDMRQPYSSLWVILLVSRQTLQLVRVFSFKMKRTREREGGRRRREEKKS